MQWSVLTGEMTTGQRITSLPFTGGRWSRSLGSGSIEVTIPTRSAQFAIPVPLTVSGATRWVPGWERRRDLRLATQPPRMFCAVLVWDQVLEAGPIWVREEPGPSVSLRASGLWPIWDHRLLISHLVDWSTPGAVAGSSLTYSGLSLGTIAKRMIEELVAHTGGSLPLTLPADESGTHERTYPGFEMAMAGQRLSELTQVEDGPEIDFPARLSDDRQGVEWTMRTGTTADRTLHQTGMDWVIDARAPRGRVGALTVTEDASAMTVRALAKGAGSDTSTLISRQALRSDLLTAGFPLLDSARSYSTVTEQTTIDGHAAADLAENDQSWLTWKCTVELDERTAQMRPGDWCTVRVGKDRLLVEPGDHRARIASLSGQIGGRTMDLTMMPEAAA